MARRARSLVAVAATFAALRAVAGCALSLDGLSGGVDADSGPAPMGAADADDAADAADAASSDGGDAAATAFLSIDPPIATVRGTYDLTALGDLDWVQWTKSRVTKCAPCTTRIGSLASAGQAIAYTDDARQFTWSNGTPIATAAVSEGIYVVGVGSHFDFTVDAAPARAVLTFDVDTFFAGAALSAQLDGVTVAAQKVVAPPVTGTALYAIKVHFNAPAGSVLHLSWTMNADLLVGTDAGDTANIAVIAATLGAD
ncbi:MAG: hypothetical protein JWM74_5076 [Myxococcaceae bacterium]|nr:hypothetical protein [Myxococcaceae bacterium]